MVKEYKQPKLPQSDTPRVKAASEARGRHSSTASDSGSALGDGQRSFTPAIPNTSPLSGKAVRSSPLGSQSSKVASTPLRSALKRSSMSADLHRSVSFATDQTSSPLRHKLGYKPGFVAVEVPVRKVQLDETVVQNNDNLASKAIEKSKAEPKSIAKGEKIQLKLNIKSDKKLKGRAIEPPSPSRTDQMQPIDISSNEEESESDEESTHEQGHPGPSSWKSTPRPVAKVPDPTVKVNPKGVPLDPAFDALNAPFAGSSGLDLIRRDAVKLSASNESHPTRPTKSLTQKAAQATSETISITSGSSSSTGSESELDSGSESKSDDGASQLRASTPSRPPQVFSTRDVGMAPLLASPPRPRDGAAEDKDLLTAEKSDDIDGGAKTSEADSSDRMQIDSKSPDKDPLQANTIGNIDDSTKSSEVDSRDKMQIDGKPSDKAHSNANQKNYVDGDDRTSKMDPTNKIQVDTKTLVQTKRIEPAKSAPLPTNEVTGKDKANTQSRKISKFLPSTAKPSAYRYPSLAMQRKIAQANTAEEEASVLSAARRKSSQPHDHESSTSEISDNEISSSDDSEEEGKDGGKGVLSPGGSRTSSERKKAGFPGMSGVLKRMFFS